MPLGFFVISFADALMKNLNKVYYYHNQYTVAKTSNAGANPSTDSAIVSLENEHRIPEVLYEYKPVMDFDLERVEGKAVIEGLLQARYCVQFYLSFIVLRICMFGTI